MRVKMVGSTSTLTNLGKMLRKLAEMANSKAQSLDGDLPVTPWVVGALIDPTEACVDNIELFVVRDEQAHLLAPVVIGVDLADPNEKDEHVIVKRKRPIRRES